MANKDPVILWFRQDLRIRDNEALAAALESKRPIIPVFIWDEKGEGSWSPGGAARVFLRCALKALEDDLTEYGLQMVFRKGESREVLSQLIEECDAGAVYWNRRYEPSIVSRDSEIKKGLLEDGKEAESFNSSLLFEPWKISTQQGKPFQVFTPFWKNAKKRDRPRPVEVDLRKLTLPDSFPESGSIESLELTSGEPWEKKIAKHWEVSEGAAHKRMEKFLSGPVSDYDGDRDLPAVDGTSRLSPFLHWGLIGPRQIWEAVIDNEMENTKGGRTYVSEIGWREFAYHVLYHFPKTPEKPLREKYEDFPWETNQTHLERWKKGQTGYPIVDAGMRQLWQEGWMHNRVRMVVGSFLVKHLLQSWEEGAKWFWDCLVDADLASNTLGWQWSGGCGADAAPYFRVFNPMTQGEKFDGDGEYVRKYVPELGDMPDKFIHEPWEAPRETLEDAGVELGKDYPEPIIEHKKGRERALAAFDKVKG